MTKTTQEANRNPKDPPALREVISLAAWFGAVAGLVEGGMLLAFQKFPWVPWSIRRVSVSPDIVWISSVFDLLLFLAVGLILKGLRRWFPRLLSLSSCFSFFIGMSFFDWISIFGRIHALAALVLSAGLASVAMRWFSRHESSAMRFARLSLRWVLAAVLAALLGVQAGGWLKERIATAFLPAAPGGTPNILVIVVDTLRADHLSAYGYPRPTSPNVDRIARQGVLFENSYSASSWTLPSHASLLTGRHLYEHADSRRYYDGRFPNLAQALQDSGFRTGAFSANEIYFCRVFGFGRGFLHFEDVFSSVDDMVARTIYGRKLVTHVLQPLGYRDILGRKRAQEVNGEFLRWVDLAPRRRFFAFLNYFDVHYPYSPPQPYGSQFMNAKDHSHVAPGGPIDQTSFLSGTVKSFTAEQLQYERNSYDGAIAFVDAEIGQLFSELNKRGLDESTLVVITSDHGEELGEHGLPYHGDSLYRQEVHVPLIFWWPAKVPAGMRIHTPVSNASLPATIMSFLPPQRGSIQFPGGSLAQLWKDPVAALNWPVPLVELGIMPYDADGKYPIGYGGMKSLITPRWQYIWKGRAAEELYDLEADPQESHDLAASPDAKATARELFGQLRGLVGRGLEENEASERNQIHAPNLAGSPKGDAPAQLP